jgi:hypothetical protein
MPGEGPVIYNSAETVKNFAGFKQPAIMPPQSSKAGKNYQQAFGNIHGFDPYAAGGYIPNFSKPTLGDLNIRQLGRLKSGQFIKFNDRKYFADDFGGKETVVGFSSQLKAKDKKPDKNAPGAISLAAMLVPKEGYRFKPSDTPPFASYGTGKDKMTWPVYTLKSQFEKPTNLTDKVKKKFELLGSKYSTEVSKLVGGGNITTNKFWKEIENDRAGGGKGAWKAAVGAIFEAAINAALGYKAAKGHPEQGDFDVRGGEDLNKVRKLFNLPAGIPVADYKSNAASKGNRKSFRDKVLKEGAFKAAQMKSKTKAYGHIPNFADPLSDAIGREKAAGVPVSQIRVGSHGALMSKGNPLGLGVTNTHDEPNGLRDVFGANGFVPNYVASSAYDFSAINAPWAGEKAKRFNKLLDRFTKQFEQGTISFKELHARTKRMAVSMKMNSGSMENLLVKQNDSISAIDKLNAKRRGLMNSLSRQNQRFAGTAIGKGLSSTGGQMGIMMGAPMLAGFLQEGGALKGGASYNVGGALAGAGAGASMGMMFGPLGTAIGALGGAIIGYQGAMEENTEALKERSNEISKQNADILTQTFGPKISQSIFGGEDSSRKISQFKAFEALPEYKNIKEITTAGSGVGTVLDYTVGALAQGVNDIINFVNPFASILDKSNPNNLQVGSFAEGMRGFEVGSDINIAEASNMARQTMIDTVMPILQKDIINAFKDMGDETLTVSKIIQDKETGKSKFGDKKTVTTASGYLKELTESGILEDADQIKILAENLVELYELNNKAKDDEKKGIIIQLNLQRAMITAQKASADAQLEIKSKFLDQINLLDSQEKLLGGLISEEQKVRIKYNKSLLKASEVYQAGAEEAAKAYKTGLIQDITSKPAMQQELKKELFGGGAGDKTMVDVTGKLAKMNAKELEAILLKIGKTQQEANEIVSNRNLLYENAIDTLKQQEKLTNKRSQLERDLNIKLAERKTLMEDINREMDSYVGNLDYASKLRGISSELQAARFGAGPARTQQEVFAEQQRLVGERQQNIQSEYIQSALSTTKSFADKVGLSEEQRMQIIQDPSKLSEISATAISAQEEVLKSKAGYDPSLYIKKLTENTTKRQEQLTEFSTRPEADQKTYKKQYEEAQKTQKKELEELQLLKTLQQSINDAKAEQTKESKKITEELERQIGLKDAQISKEEELQRIREKEYARKTGPGAFGEGMKDAVTDMQKEVALLDYELGQNIPRNLANGLATAMQETLNGAKSLDEALQGAAMNFLQMIQQAMLKKAAMQVVGAMGFSRGGNVRKYSQGGGVPAMVTNGEYVMGRDAVNKYGGAFMHGMNAGGNVPGFSNGGATGSALAANFGGGRGYKSGRAYQSKAMSGFFYSQSGNVGLGEDRESLLGVLAEEERKRQEALAKKAKKRALLKQIIGTVASIGISAGVSGAFNKSQFGDTNLSLEEAAFKTDAMKNPTNYSLDELGAMGLNPDGSKQGSLWNKIKGGLGFRYNGGPIRKYASGGHISGKSGIDQIPAMLSEGEYVIRASSARQIGRPMLDRINAGKFNDGGAVSEIAGSSETGSTGGNTNNINISINMERGKAKQDSQDSGGQNPADRSNDEQNSAALADRIKQQVVAVIVEEQRPGGLLDEKS